MRGVNFSARKCVITSENEGVSALNEGKLREGSYIMWLMGVGSRWNKRGRLRVRGGAAVGGGD